MSDPPASPPRTPSPAPSYHTEAPPHPAPEVPATANEPGPVNAPAPIPEPPALQPQPQPQPQAEEALPPMAVAITLPRFISPDSPVADFNRLIAATTGWFYAMSFGLNGMWGLCLDWSKCAPYVIGVRGAIFKKYRSIYEAIAVLLGFRADRNLPPIPIPINPTEPPVEPESDDGEDEDEQLPALAAPAPPPPTAASNLPFAEGVETAWGPALLHGQAHGAMADVHWNLVSAADAILLSPAPSMPSLDSASESSVSSITAVSTQASAPAAAAVPVPVVSNSALGTMNMPAASGSTNIRAGSSATQPELPASLIHQVLTNMDARFRARVARAEQSVIDRDDAELAARFAELDVVVGLQDVHAPRDAPNDASAENDPIIALLQEQASMADSVAPQGAFHSLNLVDGVVQNGPLDAVRIEDAVIYTHLSDVWVESAQSRIPLLSVARSRAHTELLASQDYERSAELAREAGASNDVIQTHQQEAMIRLESSIRLARLADSLYAQIVSLLSNAQREHGHATLIRRRFRAQNPDADVDVQGTEGKGKGRAK
ncbi:unnamed protein product [Peniophora sp. CBMAI 1063]|nr:unnamed protein product [Peniophora sp. CBMAI 1063]